VASASRFDPYSTHQRSLVKWILRVATDHQVGVRFSQDRPYWSVLFEVLVVTSVAKTATEYTSIWGIGVIGNAVDLHSTVRSSNLLFSTKVLLPV
jgi:hypothetical protein